MYCTECYSSVDDQHETCPRCGATLSEQDDLLSESEASQNGESTTAAVSDTGSAAPNDSVSLSEAEAVDVACPHCEERPIEEVAKGWQMTGFLVAFQWKSREILGCHRCVRSEIMGMGGKTFLLGWWSYAGVLLTPFIVLWDLIRGSYNRGPNRHLVKELEDEKIPFSFLADSASFDAEAYHPLDGHVRAVARLVVAAAQSRGRVGEQQREEIRNGLGQMAPDYPRSNIDRVLDQVIDERLDADAVAAELARTLPLSWKRGALQLVDQIHRVESSSTIPDLVYRLAERMGVEKEEVDASL